MPFVLIAWQPKNKKNFRGWNIDQVTQALWSPQRNCQIWQVLSPYVYVAIVNCPSIWSVYQSNIQQVTSQWTERVFGSDREPLRLLVVLYSFVPIMVKADDGNDLNSEVLLRNETFKSIHNYCWNSLSPGCLNFNWRLL